MTRTMILLAPAVALSTPALAFGPGFGGPDHEVDPEVREARFQQTMDEIGATEDQRSSLRVLFEDTLPTLKSLHDEGRALREEMQEVFLYSETVDRGEVEVLRVDAVDLFDRASATMMDLMVDAANVLSMDQRQALHELREERRHRFHQRLKQWHDTRD